MLSGAGGRRGARLVCCALVAALSCGWSCDGARKQKAGKAAGGDSLETVVASVERFRRAVGAPGDTYPVPPKPEEVARMTAELERGRAAVSDAKLKARVEESLKYMPFMMEASRAFWGARDERGTGGTPQQNSPAGAGGGTGAGTGAGLKPSPSP